MTSTKGRVRIVGIRAKHSYTLAELALTCRVHHRTAQRWPKEGLKVLDDRAKPFLVMGYDALAFLKDRRKKRKHPLGTGEFFCPRCRLPRKSQPGAFKVERTARRLGKASFHVIIRGQCEVCGSKMLRFASDRQIVCWDTWGRETTTARLQSRGLRLPKEEATPPTKSIRSKTDPVNNPNVISTPLASEREGTLSGTDNPSVNTDIAR